MKKLLVTLSDLALSREQMKKVKGGKDNIECTVTCNFQGGQSVSYTGSCGAGSVTNCLNATPAGYDTGGNCVHSSCWPVG